MKLTFGKSKSPSYQSFIRLAQSLPNYSEESGIVSCGAKTIREYLIYHTELEQLMQGIEYWKNSQITLFDITYNIVADFWRFRERIALEAGKYAPILKSGTVALSSITLEELPYPIVYYPSQYGAFFAFAKDIDDEICFCECERQAIENYIALRNQSPLKNYSGSKTYPLGADYFSEIIAQKSLQNPENPLSLFRFEPNLCHRCNKKIPKLHYCLDMYAEGNKFKKMYGWFINQEYFHCGLDLYQADNILPDKLPPEISDYFTRCEALRVQRQLNPENTEIQDELDMYGREFINAIENRAREKLGFKKKGETWISETILFNIIKGLYPTSKVVKHHRPKWLQGLELDIYLPEHKMAFEYQGIQHFVAIEHWGGIKQLQKQQEHDQRKKMLCKDKGVTLICINHYDPLNEDFVKSQIELHTY